MPVVGTAGHVDHGKSTLVRALTGLEPDRWAEEKARGLTIDLGFAWTELDGREVSFVDVPGHEHFIKNMLAGIEAIDVALLVVAADEGWMPQSEEHLAVLDLLEITRGVVALTKVDRVDAELIELAHLEITEHLAGTALANAPIVEVSAREGVGLGALRSTLARLVGEVTIPSGDRPRLWVDRSFSIAGAGTVVTGTLLDAPLASGDQLHLWPLDRSVRVRSIQTHERSVEHVEPQRRVALNLSGVDRDEAERGSMIGRLDQWLVSDRVHVSVIPARYVDEITDRGAYHFHVGSGSWPCRVRVIADDRALITLETPLPLSMGDRFVLRETGRRLVVGGGMILDPAPPRRSRDLHAHGDRLRAALEAGPNERATALLELRGVAPGRELAAHSGGGCARGGIDAGPLVLSSERASTAAAVIRDRLDEFHRNNPLRAGMPVAALPASVRLPIEGIEAVLAGMGDVVREEALVRLADFRVDRSGRDEEWAAARSELRASGLSVPRVADLDIDRELLHALVRDGELVRISQEFVYLPSQVDEIVAHLSELTDGFTVSEFKDRTGLSRKYAVPFLEWADGSGLTVRMGDLRRIRPTRA